MLIKRMLLVALLATGAMKLVCGVDKAVMDGLVRYGVPSNTISDANFLALIEQAKLVDDWNEPSDMAVSSIIRAQFSTDSTLPGISSAPAGVNPDDLKALIAAESSKSERQVIADRILAGLSAGASAGAGAGAGAGSGSGSSLLGTDVGADTALELAALSDEGFKSWVENIRRAWGNPDSGDLKTNVQNMKNSANSTLLTAAVGESNEQYVDYLLALGIDPNIINAEGKRAVEYSSNGTITTKINSRS